MGNNVVDISVIVPVYNVEEYLAECLDSLLNQGSVKLEVIMIDDGSPDSSGQIADSYAEKYDNFHCYHIENGGLGHARNYGMQYATGKYVYFIDSDDVLTNNILERMFQRAEQDGSELTICNVVRFNARKTWHSGLHDLAFYNLEPITHIKKQSQLLYDTTSWNKLILRSFYEKNAFKFPEKILYEDIPVTIPMHYLANQVSVLHEVGYLWRTRDGASSSITQNVDSTKNLVDRITIMRMLDAFFEKHVPEEHLHLEKQLKSVDIDLFIFVNACQIVDKEQGLKNIEYINQYIDDSVGEEALNKLSLIKQEIYRAVRACDYDRVIELLIFRKKKMNIAPITEKEGRLYADLPEEYFSNGERDVTEELIRHKPRAFCDDIRVEKSGIEIDAHVYRRRINYRNVGDQVIKASLYNDASNHWVELETVPMDTAFLTDNFGTVVDKESDVITEYNYDKTGCTVKIPFEVLTGDEKCTGTYMLALSFKNRFEEGFVILEGISSANRMQYKNTAYLNNNSILQLQFTRMKQLRFVVERDLVELDQFSAGKDKLICRLNKAGLSLVAKNFKNDEEFAFSEVSSGEYQIESDMLKDDTRYNLYADIDGIRRRIYAKAKETVISQGKNNHLIINSLRNHAVDFRMLSRMAEISKPLKLGSMLFVKLTCSGMENDVSGIKTGRLVVYDKINRCYTELARSKPRIKKAEIINHFRINFADEQVVRNFYKSTRDVRVIYTCEDGHEEMVDVYVQSGFMRRFEQKNLKIECYRSYLGTFRIQLAQVWNSDEDSKQKRNKLYQKYYPEYCKEPINPKRIVFESMWGKKYSCNPKALYEYIDQNHPEYECIWSFTDQRFPVKGNAIRVRRNSLEYWHYMATAKYLVNNVNFGDDYIKREGQIEIQTMHGTPLKTLGLDVKQDFRTEEAREKFIQKNQRWNYLIVQGEFMEEKAFPVWHFEKEILRTGYPRTDELYHCSDERKAELREIMGIPEGKKVILYAPTWRRKGRFDLELDLQLMKEAFQDEYVLAIRLHHLANKCGDLPNDDPFVINLTAYHSIEDIYQITDVLITDYSSVMFDFALLDKPMLFFTYDMEDYSEQLRGLYVDFTSEAPGPLLYDTEGLVDEIRKIDQYQSRYQEKIAAFREKYLTYECENSCEKVFEQVMKD